MVVASLLIEQPDPAQRKDGNIDSAIARTVGGMAVGDYSSYRERFWTDRDYKIDGEVDFWTGVFTSWQKSYGDFQNAGRPFAEDSIALNDFVQWNEEIFAAHDM